MEPELLETLYRSYARELTIYLYSLCRNRELAEDLVQDVFLKALLSLDKRHPNFRAWLYQVGKNLCLNEMKKQKHVHWQSQQEGQSSDSVLSLLLRQEENQVLFDALFTLPPLHRELLTLQYFSGIPQKEIAQILNLSPGNVRIIAHRARKELKKRLEAQGYVR